MPPIAFVTSAAYPELTGDDLLAARACEARGLGVIPILWDDPRANWDQYHAVVIRSTWDYHRRHAEFDRWLARLDAAGARVWNPIHLLRWNADKRYLATLAARGVPTVPTEWMTPIAGPPLGTIMDRAGWDDVVIKPAISATAHGTHRVRRADADALTADMLGAGTDYLVQPFVPQIETVGEWSLMFFDRVFSHSVRKRPTKGDFRVQAEYGGSSVAEPAPRDVIAAAARVLDAVDGPWVYARVDGIETDRGFLLMELEMLEPMLFFGWDPAAPARFAGALEALIGRPAES